MRLQEFLACLTDDDRPPRKPALFLALLIILALGVRLSLYRYHHIIEGDGVHYAALARLISRDGNFLGAANEYWSNLWPLVVAFFDLFIHDIELAGRLASTLFGALTVIPVYLVAREFLNARTSLAAAALALPQPYLLRFSVLMYTESFFTFLFALTLWIGIRLVKSPKAGRRWFLLGLIVGLSLWTRPEILAPAFVYLLVAAVRGLTGRIPVKSLVSGWFVFLGMVLFFLLSRAVLVHHFQGKWHFGFANKVSVDLREGLRYYRGGDHEKFLSKFEDGRFVNVGREVDGSLAFLLRNRPEVFGRMEDNARRITQSYAAVLEPTKGMPHHRELGAAIIFLGVLSIMLARRTRPWAWLFLAILVSYSVPWLLIFVVDRFVVPLSVISVVLTAAGLMVLERAAAALFRRRRLTAWPILPLLFVTAFTMRTASWARHDRGFIWERDPIVQKDAGRYLKEHFPQRTKTLTWGPHIPYYFYDGNPYTLSGQNIPWAPYDEVMSYVRREKFNLLVLPEWVLLNSDFPIKNLASEGVRAPGLDFVAVIGQNTPERVWIYRVIEPAPHS